MWISESKSISELVRDRHLPQFNSCTILISKSLARRSILRIRHDLIAFAIPHFEVVIEILHPFKKLSISTVDKGGLYPNSDQNRILSHRLENDADRQD